ncbi:hypothetical protein [Streptomyces sp. NPDC086787]|uniref:hypothetical protein n=1 Tax=Streptomyces sp. NPDC086787 TaxID=3365759 RepID=UPI00380FF2AB
MDSDADAWRALQVADCLRPAAGELVPRLSRRLADADLSKQWPESSVGTLVSTLGRLGDPAAVPVIVETVATAVRHEQWHTAASALEALASFGTAAASALEVVRPLADTEDGRLRMPLRPPSGHSNPMRTMSCRG